ncbi:hypothetical protein INS49_007953 [Diaporthe citri]|uniref:uncharacterized protein n=1 Tax=Diaporthe citri TaxID=83186 RepID=UPI001C7EC8F4|nr:uncharacterized protein INS49_007953 [Diaporthe citri]KAG6362858.1 hypothetical protein INS49_007953 [Diaporthe citri]
MPSIHPAYDALPSDTASASPTLCQPENQLSCKKADPTTVPRASKLPKRTCISPFWTGWEWEFAACFLVLVTPIIVFATLYPHDGQPLPQWPFKVSINSLLSIYALVFKADVGFILTSCIGQLQWAWFSASETRPLTDMLHFDNATRGADGALGLIWRQRFRQPLAAIGCVLMVLAVAVDPFVQQLVQPADCSVEVSGGIAAATLPRANVFEEYGYDGNVNSHEAARNMSMSDLSIEKTMYDAIFSPGQHPPWQCSTGNCTFPDPYATIGVCSSCQDASANVITNTSCSQPDSSYASHHPKSGADCPVNSSFIVESNFTAGEYISLGTKLVVPNDDPGEHHLQLHVGDATLGLKPVALEPVSLMHDALFGIIVATARYPIGVTDSTFDESTCNSNESERSWQCQGYGAATCSLRPCVRIYDATISAGVLEENLIASSSETAWGFVSDDGGSPRYRAMVDTQCSAENQTPSNRNSSVESRWLPYSFNLTVKTDPTVGAMYTLADEVTSLLQSGCLYVVSDEAIMSTAARYLNGSLQSQADSFQSFESSESGYKLLTAGYVEGPEILRSIYHQGDTDLKRVQSVFANISDSLTTYIRSHGGSEFLPARLTTFVYGMLRAQAVVQASYIRQYSFITLEGLFYEINKD